MDKIACMPATYVYRIQHVKCVPLYINLINFKLNYAHLITHYGYLIILNIIIVLDYHIPILTIKIAINAIKIV